MIKATIHPDGTQAPYFQFKTYGSWRIGYRMRGGSTTSSGYLFASDDNKSDYPLIVKHDSGEYRVYYDYPERVPSNVKEWIKAHAEELETLRAELNRVVQYD